MSEILKNRREILFLYDIKDANPNGDPMDENKPRMDEETDTNIVTDVRLKRTIRDYLHDFKGYNGKNGRDIFVKEIIYDSEGHIQDAKRRAKDFIRLTGDENDEEKELIEKFKNGKKIKINKIEILKSSISKNLLLSAIDIRLFGATIPLEFKKNETEERKEKKSSVTYTGPVQFRMGRSMHKVEVKFIQGTGAFASKEGATQKTFREEYIVPYSLIAFYGIVNENAAKSTKMTEDDLLELRDAIWNGTKNLISRSKAGQMPRLYIEIEYKENNYHIGDLDKYIRLVKKDETMDDKAIRDVSDFTIEIGPLYELLSEHKDSIKDVIIKKDERLILTKNGEQVDNPQKLFETVIS